MNTHGEVPDSKKDITYFGRTNYRNTDRLFGIKRKDRRQHMYVLGKSGTGKSVLLSNMIIQNIQNGEGVCVVDPHGELVEFILENIPEHRTKDVVYFNPADTDYHMGFNVLDVVDERYKHLVASGLMGIFTKIWANVWSSRMEYILNNAILALLDTPGSTLLGVPRLLVDKDYRQKIISNLKDPVVKAFWIHEYEQWQERFRNEAIAPIQNKVGQFLSTALIRNILGQSKSTIDIFDIMNSGKIFLVNVSKGRIGEDNSALLGGMLITKIQLAAMERVRIPENERKDFYLYVDEFQNFATESFASILSEARKYRLNLTLAHQYIGQLSSNGSDAVRDAVFGNVGTMIVFRVGAADAEFLEKEFEPEFLPEDFVNLPNYHVYLKLMVDGITSRPFSAKTLAPIQVDATAGVANRIIESSRVLYTKSREVVEEEINNWAGMAGPGGVNRGEAQEGKFKAQCVSCQKETTVPFEPIPGRPVYCKDCLAKIKSGEIQPVRGFAPRDNREKERDESKRYQDLSFLGIEFKLPDSLKKVFPKQEFKKPEPKKFADKLGLQEILKEALVETKPEPISLTDLKKPNPIVVPERKIPEPPKIENAPAHMTLVKEASDKNRSALKDVLAAAMQKPVEEKKIEPEIKKEETVFEKSEVKEEKKPKEVPEEILRKILE